MNGVLEEGDAGFDGFRRDGSRGGVEVPHDHRKHGRALVIAVARVRPPDAGRSRTNDERDPLRSVAPNRLHSILAGHTAWTDELFGAATRYLSGKLSTASMRTLAALIADADVLPPDGSHQLRTELFKEAQMRIYRRYTTSVLLGFYKLARVHGLLREK